MRERLPPSEGELVQWQRDRLGEGAALTGPTRPAKQDLARPLNGPGATLQRRHCDAATGIVDNDLNTYVLLLGYARLHGLTPNSDLRLDVKT